MPSKKEEVKEKDYDSIPLPKGGKIHHHYLTGAIKYEPKILGLIKCLKCSGPKDLIYIYLNSQGGDLDITTQIINSINATRATVVTVADGEVSSAASLIFFAGHALEVSEYSTFLIHNGSVVIGGKFNEVKDRVANDHAFMEKLFHGVYGKFLSSSEIDKVLSGRDIILSSEQVITRINKAVEELQDESKKG